MAFSGLNYPLMAADAVQDIGRTTLCKNAERQRVRWEQFIREESKSKPNADTTGTIPTGQEAAIDVDVDVWLTN